jgi:dipeptidyl-peptidase-4
MVSLFSLDGVDEALNVVYFSGNRDVAIERHLYRAALVPDEKAPQAQQLTVESGFHNATVNVAGGFVADVFSSVTSPVVLRLYGLSESGLTLRGELLDNLYEGSRLNKPGMREALVPPVFRTIRSLDGLVDLHCALYLPPGVTVDSALRLPAIMSVYGGPHVQTVRNQWTLTAELRSQRMAQQGFVVIKCDNRGSSRRGLAFEGAMHRDMGNIEVADQTAAVQHFAQAGLIDASRVGMFGWSYGGYMSAMSLCRAPDVFSCAVAGAPVTSWDGYDTHYTGEFHFICHSSYFNVNCSSLLQSATWAPLRTISRGMPTAA